MGYERSCLSDHIRRELARRILDGTLKPGERLVELKIAAEFESSQTPVREALRELESLRLVESSPYRGTRVRDVGERRTLLRHGDPLGRRRRRDRRDVRSRMARPPS